MSVAGGLVGVCQNELVPGQNEHKVPDTGAGEEPEEGVHVVQQPQRVKYCIKSKHIRKINQLPIIENLLAQKPEKISRSP